MALYGSIMIAAGYNMAGSLVAVETVIDYAAPRASMVNRGAVRAETLDRKQHYDGQKSITWEWGIIPRDTLGTLVTGYFGGWDSDNGTVTIRAQTRAGSWANYNAIAHTPEYNVDYEQPTTTKLTKVVIKFVDLEAI